MNRSNAGLLESNPDCVAHAASALSRDAASALSRESTKRVATAATATKFKDFQFQIASPSGGKSHAPGQVGPPGVNRASKVQRTSLHRFTIPAEA